MQVCLFFGNLFAVVLLLAYRPRFAKDGSGELFVAGKLLQLALLALLLLRDAMELRYALPLIALLGLAGAAAESLSMLKLLGVYRKQVRNVYLWLTAVSGGVLLPLSLPGNASAAFTACSALAGAALLLYPAYVLGMKSRSTPLQSAMGWLYGAVIVTLLFKVPAAFGWAPQPWAAGLLRDLFYIGIYLLMFLGTAGLMLLSREQSYAELERVAAYDELTGTLNRRAFTLRARSLIAAHAREGIPYSFLLLDVDHFKNINDTYGHDTGDEVLRRFARKVESQLGSGDLFGRFGGEEFAVLLHRADENASSEMAEQLRRSVLVSLIEGATLSCSVSIGVVTAPPGAGISLNTLYKLSDAALYQAKRRGRNCVVRSREQIV